MCVPIAPPPECSLCLIIFALNVHIPIENSIYIYTCIYIQISIYIYRILSSMRTPSRNCLYLYNTSLYLLFKIEFWCVVVEEEAVSEKKDKNLRIILTIKWENDKQIDKIRTTLTVRKLLLEVPNSGCSNILGLKRTHTQLPLRNTTKPGQLDAYQTIHLVLTHSGFKIYRWTIV